jgi:hypothetical protein
MVGGVGVVKVVCLAIACWPCFKSPYVASLLHLPPWLRRKRRLSGPGPDESGAVVRVVGVVDVVEVVVLDVVDVVVLDVVEVEVLVVVEVEVLVVGVVAVVGSIVVGA